MRIKRLILSLLPIVVVLALAVLAYYAFIAIRHAGAISQAEQSWANTHVQPLDTLGTTQRLSILPLIDMNAQGNLKGEWGVSYLIRTDKAVILFDVGQNADGSAPLLSNMEQLGVSADSFDSIVFSHNHPDHVGGISQTNQGTFSLGKPVDLTGKRVFAPVPMTYPGTSVVVATDPTIIAPGVATTGTIQYPESTDPNVEQSLVVNVAGKGIVVIAGCGHPTLQKMLPRATALVNTPVYGFVGGLHLMDADAKTLQPTIDYLKTYQLRLLAPSAHDSGVVALDTLRAAFPDAYRDVIVGQEIVIGE
jgi:7,8-dihydropterin-6-yl-methyl-4-(beta-D-ribofuranosyl)aminobenzene 5'-phosphate synthase